MEPEMVSTPVGNATAFLQLRDKYKQDLVEDTRLTKAADLAAKQYMLLVNESLPDAWKRPQLKAVGRQLRHWTKKVRQPFGAPVGGVGGPGAPATPAGEDDFDAGPVHAWLTQLVKTAQGIKRSAPSTSGRKPPVPPKPQLTPSAKKKLKFTPQVSSAELAQELPFSGTIGQEPWETPKERSDTLKKSISRRIRKKTAETLKTKGKGVAKKSLKKVFEGWKEWK